MDLNDVKALMERIKGLVEDNEALTEAKERLEKKAEEALNVFTEEGKTLEAKIEKLQKLVEAEIYDKNVYLKAWKEVEKVAKDLQDEVDHWKELYDQKAEELRKFSEEHNWLKKDFFNLKKQYAEFVEYSIKDISVALSNARDLEQDNKTLRAKLDTGIAAYASLEDNISELRKQLRETKVDLKEAKKSRDAWEKRAAKLKKDIETMNTWWNGVIDNKDKYIKQKDDEAFYHEKVAEYAKKELSKFKTSNDELAAENSKLIARIVSLEKENKELKDNKIVWDIPNSMVGAAAKLTSHPGLKSGIVVEPMELPTIKDTPTPFTIGGDNVNGTLVLGDALAPYIELSFEDTTGFTLIPEKDEINVEIPEDPFMQMF